MNSPPSDSPWYASGPFRAYLAATALWFAGVGTQMVLFPYLVAGVLNERASLVGVAQMATLAPGLIFLLPAGALADHADGKVLLFRFSMIALLPPVALSAIVLAGGLSFGVLVAYALIVGSLSALSIPPRDALLSRVTPPGSLQNAVSLVVSAQFGMQIVGMLAVIPADYTGAAPILVFQATLFALSLFALHHVPAAPPGNKVSRTLQERAHDIKDGVIEALTHPAIMPVTAAMASVALVLMGSFMTIIPILIRDAHHGSSAQFTFVNIAFWTGTIVSNATLMRMPSIHYPGRAMAIALIGGMGVLFLLSFETPFWVLCLLTFVWGMGAGVTMTMGRTVVQENAPDSHRARVLSVYQLAFAGVAPFGALAFGFVIEAVGVHAAARIGPVVIAVILTVLATQTRWLSIRSHAAQVQAN